MENKDYISLTGEKELRIYMMPLRQKIIQAMRIEGRPVTAKYIADKLGISPSSASHHIKQLQQIGIVEFDHSQLINGITANYMRVTDKTIRLGSYIDDELSVDRDALTRNMVYEMYSGITEATEHIRSLDPPPDIEDSLLMAEIMSGVAHLTGDECRELHRMIMEFTGKHEKADSGTHPYSYMLMIYRNDLDKDSRK